MSSTILYLAIVAIWAGVLVPRWLRREPHHDASARARRTARRTDAPPQETAGDDTGPAGAADNVADDAVIGGQTEGTDGDTRPGSLAGTGRPGPARADADSHGPADPRPGDPRPGSRPADDAGGSPRADRAWSAGRGPASARTIAARRRLLTMLTLLLLGAMAIAVAGLAAWWVILPPAGMYAGYVALLREAARADAELAAQRGHAYPAGARLASRAAPAAGSAAPSLATAGLAADGVAADGVAADRLAAAALAVSGATASRTADAADDVAQAPSAQIIDLTQRAGEQLYDQYADAKLRAVGD